MFDNGKAKISFDRFHSLAGSYARDNKNLSRATAQIGHFKIGGKIIDRSNNSRGTIVLLFENNKALITSDLFLGTQVRDLRELAILIKQ